MALTDFTRSLPMLLYQALDAVMPRFRRIFNGVGITEQQWRVLRVLIDEPASTVSGLAAHTLIPAPSLVGVIDRLEAAGLVFRQRRPADRRVVEVVATEQGRQLQETLMPLVTETYAAILKSMPPREWARLIESLERVADMDDASG